MCEIQIFFLFRSKIYHNAYILKPCHHERLQIRYCDNGNYNNQTETTAVKPSAADKILTLFLKL